MACCNNNDCLEPVYTGCLEYTGAQLQCIQGENVDSMLESIDSMLQGLYCNPEVEIEEDEITIDLKCLAGNCGEDLNYSISYLKGTPNSIIGVTPVDFVTNSTGSITAYHNGMPIASQTGVNFPLGGTQFIVPTTYINDGGVTLKISAIVNGIFYSGTFFLTTTMAGGLYNNLKLKCEAPANTTTLSIKTLLQSLINEVCELKTLVG
jgi:hypothetical protein